MALAIVSEVHDYVAREHCRRCNSRYMQKYRTIHKQKQYSKKSEEERIAKRVKEWLAKGRSGV